MVVGQRLFFKEAWKWAGCTQNMAAMTLGQFVTVPSIDNKLVFVYIHLLSCRFVGLCAEVSWVLWLRTATEVWMLGVHQRRSKEEFQSGQNSCCHLNWGLGQEPGCQKEPHI